VHAIENGKVYSPELKRISFTSNESQWKSWKACQLPRPETALVNICSKC